MNENEKLPPNNPKHKTGLVLLITLDNFIRLNFVGIPLFSNPLWVAMETMHFHIANILEDNFVSNSGGPNEQFGGGGGGRGQGNLNWMSGYNVCYHDGGDRPKLTIFV